MLEARTSAYERQPISVEDGPEDVGAKLDAILGAPEEK